MINTKNKEDIRLLRSTALPDFEMLTVKNSAHRWRVFHERYSVCNCEFVAADIRYRGKMLQAGDRSTLIFEAGETHTTERVAKPQDFQVMHFAPETVREFSQELGVRGEPHFKDALVDSEALFSSGKLLEKAILDNAPLLEQQICFTQYLGTLLSSHLERRAVILPDPGKLPMLRVRDYLHANFAKSVTLEELTSISGFSRYYLVKAFAKEYGLPPHQYQIHVRIERSLPLLRQGMTLTNVAQALGFTDQSHFFRYFTRIMGLTPGNYLGKRSG